MQQAKVETPKEEPIVAVVPPKKDATPVKVAQHEQEDVQMKSAEKRDVKADIEDEEDQMPKKKGRLIKNSTVTKK